MTKFLYLILCLVCLTSCTTSQNREKSAVLMEEESEEAGDEVDQELAEDELEDAAIDASAVEVTDLRYVAGRNGGTIVIRTSGKAAYRLREEPGQKQFVLEVANANLPARLRRPYITQEFNQAISAINAYQEGGTTARVVIQMRNDDRLRVEQRGSEIFVAPEGTASGDSIAISSAEIEEATAAGASGGAPRDGLPLTGLSMDDLNGAGNRFYGKPISIEVRDTNVRDVISFIAEQSGANLVVSDEVAGQVTIKLKQVPWDQALLLIMKSKQLGYVRQGNVLRIATLDVLQKETESARKVVEAQRAAQPLRVRVIPVSYADIGELVTQVKEFTSQGRGKVVGDKRTSSIIVTDIIENIERITNLIKAIDIPPLQVQIEAKVVEATEGFTRQLGVEWRASGNPESLGGGISIRPSFGINRGRSPRGSFDGRITVGTLDLLGSLEATLGLFEQDQLAKIISSPSVVTMNNEPANIIQSTDVYVPTITSQGGGVTQQSFTKDKIRLELNVTPQITSSSDVIMQVQIVRQFQGAQTDQAQQPPINSREAKTKVMVANGQTAVIGGVYQSDMNQVESGLPWLRNLPLLGVLFRSTSKNEIKNELLVFVTPRILNAAEGAIKRTEM